MPSLTVTEASESFQRAMRNFPRGGADLCPVCHTFYDPDYPACLSCGRQPNHLDLVAPISFSHAAGQLHYALREYKRSAAEPVRDYLGVRLTAILWRYLREHETCIAAKAGVPGFTVVTSVPSSHPDDAQRAAGLQSLIAGVEIAAGRYETLLRYTGDVPPDAHQQDERRFAATRSLDSEAVLLIDDTWTSGGNAQSAAAVLKKAGAATVALVVIGRYLDPKWHPVQGAATTCGDLYADLPPGFDWDTCVAHP